MSMTESHDHSDLDALFALGRSGGAEPSVDLMARVMADADAVLLHHAVPVARALKARPPVWSQLVQALGGWGGIGGLLTASFAGLWLGLAGVGGDIGLWSASANATGVDLVPDAYAMLVVEE